MHISVCTRGLVKKRNICGIALSVLASCLQPSVQAAPIFDPGVSRGDYDAPNSEISGLAASRTSPGVLWAHADSGDSPRCFVLSDTAQRLGTFNLTGATHTDWEDIDIGPGPEPGISYVYIGDIGDNGTSRCNVQVYRFPEPAVYTRFAASPISKIFQTPPGIALPWSTQGWFV